MAPALSSCDGFSPDLYFKAGCYLQSNSDRGDDPGAIGEVETQKLFVTHISK